VFHDYWVRKLSPVQHNIYLNESPDANCRLLLEIPTQKYDPVVARIEANQGRILRSIDILPLLAVEIPLAALKDIASLPRVVKIWNDLPVTMIEQQVTGLEDTIAYNYDYSGKGIVVAVLDTGIFPHEDLITPNNRILAWLDLVNQKPSPYDDNGHGTQVAGIIAGNGSVSGGAKKGIAPEAWLVGIKVLDRNGNGRISDLIAAIEWCIQTLPLFNIKIINLSLNMAVQDRFYADPLLRAITAAWRKGLTVITTSQFKKEGATRANSPSVYLPPHLITVDSLRDQQTLTLNDNPLKNPELNGSTAYYHLKPDLITSGDNLASLGVDGDYNMCCGGSMATAIVTGATALILQKWPYCQPDRIKYLLMKKAKDLGLGQNLQGAGLLNIEGIIGIARKKPAANQSIVPMNMNQIMWTILKMMSQNSEGLGDYPKEIFINLLGLLLKNAGERMNTVN
jgi:Subtilisin-like serine proteases